MARFHKFLVGGIAVFLLATATQAQNAVLQTELNLGANVAYSLGVCDSTVMFSVKETTTGKLNVYEAQWNYPQGTLSNLRLDSELNPTGLNVSCPRLSLDGKRLYYMEQEDNLWHIRTASRDSMNDHWTLGRVLTELQQPGLNAAHQSLSGDELTIYWDNNTGTDILSATRASINDVFTNVQPVSSICSFANSTHGPGITPDELTMYFNSTNEDIFRATRSTKTQPFGNFTRMTFSSSANDWNAYVSPDENYVYFWSDRNGQQGIYMAEVPEPVTGLLLVLGGGWLWRRLGK